MLIEGLGLLGLLPDWRLDLLHLIYHVSCQFDVPENITVLENVETRRELNDLVLSDICRLTHLHRAHKILLSQGCSCLWDGFRRWLRSFNASCCKLGHRQGQVFSCLRCALSRDDLAGRLLRLLNYAFAALTQVEADVLAIGFNRSLFFDFFGDSIVV